MQPKTVSEIRTAFLQYFQKHQHTLVESSSLLPADDPTLLFTTAGMVQFKPYFAATGDLPYTRATSSQKCLRTTDLENVGKTERHCTFFEMLGNFSFGDYFKQTAIEYALDFSINHLGFNREDIWISVYEEDDEAKQYWLNLGIPEHKIVKLGKKDNFWGPAGETGACGPCSELYLDRGKEKGMTDCGNQNNCKPGCDCDRFIEYWNIVFNQYNQDTQGKLNPLQQTGIDTGAGLERLAMLIQNVDSVYDTDELKKLIQTTESLSQKTYSQQNADSFRVIADHSRAVCFALADGIGPDRTGRGYVIRRLIRRATLFARKLDIHEPILYRVAKEVIEIYGGAYPNLITQKETIFRTIQQEEELFLNTLESGLEILENLLVSYQQKGETLFRGEDSFKLYGTYGFPAEMTEEILAEKGFQFDKKGFAAELEKDRQHSRATWTGNQDSYGPFLQGIAATEFTGYHNSQQSGQIIKIITDGETEKLLQGQKGILILNASSFYAESGGQLGDTGTINTDKAIFRVEDTRKENDIHLHIGMVEKGEFSRQQAVQCQVDDARRKLLTYHHSGTHLLNGALRRVLGNHVMQKASLVSPEYLRFDFSHPAALKTNELEEVETLVNQAIQESVPVQTQTLSIEEAKKTGAVAAFDEKYGAEVRVVQMGDHSIEFCGGCHVGNTSEIGLFTIARESGPGAGNRRIEAVCGPAVIDHYRTEWQKLQKEYQQYQQEARELALDHKPDSIDQEVEKLFEHFEINSIQPLKSYQQKRIDAIEALRRQILQEKKARSKKQSTSLLALSEQVQENSQQIADIEVIHYQFPVGTKPDAVKQLGDKLKHKDHPVFLAFAIVNTQNAILLYMANKQAVEHGINARNLLQQTAPLIGGKGGGKPDMAQGGGKQVENVTLAIEKVIELIKNN